MVFSSVVFLFAFLPVTLLLYYLVPEKIKNPILLLASLLFYSWGEPIYVLLMLYSILLNYGMGRLMESEKAHKKAILAFTVVLNLLILGFFKYYGFAVTNINALFGLSLPIRELTLPIGISFYTFQALSYDIDLYRGKFPAQKNFIAFATYITMFPQLIAGPIVRYEDIAAQMKHRSYDLAHFGRGAARFVFGLAKKVLLANLIGLLYDTVQADGASVTTLSAWLGAIAFTFQIYFDFSGYSDMAIGLGEMFGFSFLENFDDPYVSKSVTEFWRRWHISLGSWFREYVYIPLGGNRCHVLRHIFNVFIVWFLTGLWHGANWNFILWGVYYGILLIIDKYIWSKIKWPAVISHLVTLFLVVIGWVLFSQESFAGIGATLQAMFGLSSGGFADSVSLYRLISYGPLLLVEAFFCLPYAKRWYHRFVKKPLARIPVFLFVAALLLVCTAFLVTQNYNPFLYFRF